MFYGMDTAQGEDFAQLMAQRREDLAGRTEQLGSTIRSLGSAWIGPDADSFRDRWDALQNGPIDNALEQLMELARALSAEAQEQDVTSAADALSAFAEKFDDLFRLGDFSLRNLLPNPNDWEDWVGMGLSGLVDGVSGAYSGLAKFLTSPRTLATFMLVGGDDLVNSMRGAAGAASKFSKALGPVGAVVTSGFAAWDRWEQDSADPSLSTGERIGRAAVDGGANALGGGLGAWGGAAGGAALGTMICPGVGTVIGGAVGGILGGLGGSSAANGIVDWVLG